MNAGHLSPSAFRRSLARAVVIPPALLGCLALVFIGQIGYLLSMSAWVDHTDQVIARSNALLKVLVDGETGMRGFLITGDPVFLEPYDAAEAQSGPLLRELSQLVPDNPPQVARLQALSELHAEWREFAREIIARRKNGDDYLTPIRHREDKRRMDAMRERIAEFLAAEEGLRETQVRTARTATGVVVGASLVTTLLLGAGLALLTRRQLIGVSASYRTALEAAESRAESLRRSAHRLETLHALDLAILATESVPNLVRLALNRTEQVVPAAESFVVSFDPAGGRPQVIARTEPPAGAGGPTLDDIQATDFSSEQGPRLVADLSAIPRNPMQERLFRAGCRSSLKVPLEADGERVGVLVMADPGPAAFSEEDQQVASEIAHQLAIAIRQARYREQLRRHTEELEQRVVERTHELQESLRSVKQLQGLIPICAWCKKVRDDQNYWHKVEHYVAARTDAQFTHGMCPACAAAFEQDPRTPVT